MARKKIVDPEIEQINKQIDGTIFFQVKRPLTQIEYDLLSKRVRSEAEKSGLNIVLVPYTCDLDSGGESL